MKEDETSPDSSGYDDFFQTAHTLCWRIIYQGCNTILVSVLIILLVHFLWRYITTKSKTTELKLQVFHRRAVLLAVKRRMKKCLLDQGETVIESYKRIVEKSFQELLEDLRNSRLKAIDVLRAYQLQALEVDEKTNCIVDIIEEAEHWANALDEQTDEKGPLHGLPISVKDNVYIKGLDCSLGLVKNLDMPMDDDAVIVKLLKAAGAVPFVKTNVPQTLLSYNCVNPVFGTTCNPYSKERTSGGSSGGEAALIALCGSPCGIGSDIGGSVRIPAHMCGICCLKPTANRVSGKNMRKSIYGVQGVYGVAAPMTKDVSALVTVCRILFSEKYFYLDDEIVPLPFNELMFSDQRPLRVGYYDDDGFYPLTPGCKRAVHEAKQALQKAGYEMVNFTVPDAWEAFRLAMLLLLADGTNGLQSVWKGDIIDKSMTINSTVGSLPGFVRQLISKVIKPWSPRMSVVAGETGRSAEELWKAMHNRSEYLTKFIGEWHKCRMDVLLAPGFTFPAPPHEYPPKLTPACFSTMFFNFLNFPAGSVPVTRESEEDQRKLDGYPTDDILFKFTKTATKGATGMPIGVQVVGLPWKEEMVLRVMKDLEDNLSLTDDKSRVTSSEC